MAGFPLRWGVVACATACGPSVGGTTAGSGDGESEGSSGLSIGSTGVPGESSSAAPEGSSSNGSPESSSSGADVRHCGMDTSLCGEFSVCVCTCDYDPECCTCEDSICTEDAHCGDAASCIIEAHSTGYCIPVPNCHGLGGLYQLESQADVAALEGTTCTGSVRADGASLTDLGAAASLMWIGYSLEIVNDATLTTLDGLDGLRHVNAILLDSNAVLSDVGALAGVEQIVEGGSITNNAMLPAADVHAMLAGIDGGDTVMVCGNLDDVPC
jgi:hypothetical protein